MADMAGEYRAVFRAKCSVLPPENYPRECPYIADGYRPNLRFAGAEETDGVPRYCIGFLEIPKGRLYAGESGEVIVRAIVDDAVRRRLEPGLRFDLMEAERRVAQCVVEEVQEIAVA